MPTACPGARPIPSVTGSKHANIKGGLHRRNMNLAAGKVQFSGAAAGQQYSIKACEPRCLLLGTRQSGAPAVHMQVSAMSTDKHVAANTHLQASAGMQWHSRCPCPRTSLQRPASATQHPQACSKGLMLDVFSCKFQTCACGGGLWVVRLLLLLLGKKALLITTQTLPVRAQQRLPVGCRVGS